MHKLGAVVLSAFAFSFSACDEPTTARATADNVRVPGRAVSAGVAAPTDAGDELQSVDLSVTDRAGCPLEGRAVTMVDANGKRRVLRTDERGTVACSDVRLPYDVAVEGAPMWKAPAPWVFLGLTRTVARITTGDATFRAASPPPARIRLGVLVPEDASSVEVVSISNGGAGRGRVDVAEGAGRATVALTHSFTGDALAPEEDATVHVLVTTERDAHARYGTVTIERVRAGEARDVGLVATGEIPSVDVAVMAVPELSPGFSSGVGMAVDLPGVTLAMVEGREGALVARLPVVPGGSLSAWAYAERGGAFGVPGDMHLGMRTWVSSLAVPVAAPIVLTLESPPAVSAPAAGGNLSRVTGALGWAGGDLGEARVASLALSEAGSGRVLFRLKTSERSVTFARLLALGVDPPEVGAHVLDVATSSGLDVWDLTSPAPLDVTWGRATSRRLAFQVTE